MPVVLLHGKDRDLAGTADLEDHLAQGRPTLAIQAPRAQTLEEVIVGYSWYLEPPGGPIELSTLGDALAQLEQGVLSFVQELGAQSVALVGEGQGATMALLLASAWPDLVPEVVAFGGSFHELPAGLGLPEASMRSVRIALVAGDPHGGPPDAAAAPRLRDRHATVVEVDLVREEHQSRSAWLASWLPRG